MLEKVYDEDTTKVQHWIVIELQVMTGAAADWDEDYSMNDNDRHNRLRDCINFIDDLVWEFIDYPPNERRLSFYSWIILIWKGNNQEKQLRDTNIDEK